MKESILTENKITSLYVHIPFCQEICSYCDFSKLLYLKKWVEPYFNALFDELKELHIDHKLSTIYVGGGTPTCLSNEDFEFLLSTLSVYLKTSDFEFSVEANVESLSESKLQLMKQYGVNRLSIGVQSSHDEVLKLMNRHYTYQEAKNAIDLAKKYIKNINIDLIYAYPNETLTMLQQDVDEFIRLDVNHISAYSLTIAKSTKYYLEGYRESDQDKQRTFYDYILKTLREHNYERYEVSNFARNKAYSRHNLVYWTNKQYYAIGLGACGYVNNIRYSNTKNILKYINHDYLDTKEQLNSDDIEQYYIIVNMRLMWGISLSEYKKEFHHDFLKKYQKQVDKLKNECLININNDRIMASDEGIMLLDRILVEFI